MSIEECKHRYAEFATAYDFRQNIKLAAIPFNDLSFHNLCAVFFAQHAVPMYNVVWAAGRFQSSLQYEPTDPAADIFLDTYLRHAHRLRGRIKDQMSRVREGGPCISLCTYAQLVEFPIYAGKAKSQKKATLDEQIKISQ